MKHKHIAPLAMAAALAWLPAHAEVVLVGHPSGAALSAEQVSDIYQGKSQAATPLDLPEGSGTRTEFYKKTTGKDAAQVKALWARLAFSGKGIPPKEMASAAELKKAVAADPKAIGYLDKSDVDGSVKVLQKLD